MCRALLGLCREGVTVQCHMDSRVALNQAIEFVGLAQQAAELAKKEQPDLNDCMFMQGAFKRFAMDKVWLQHLVKSEGEAWEADKQGMYEKVLQRAYNRDIKQRILTKTAQEHDLIAALDMFAKNVPGEYKAGQMPPQFLHIAPRDFSSKVASSGDDILCKQVTFILSMHNMLKLAMELKSLRTVSTGGGGAEMPMDLKFAGLLSTLRSLLAESRLLAKTSCEQNVFEVPPDSEHHLTNLDGLVDSRVMGKTCLDATEEEFQRWADAWNSELDTTADKALAGIPAGWLLHKDSLLDIGKEDVVDSLIKNPKYVECAEALAKLSNYLAVTKTFKDDGCGPFVRVDVSHKCKQAVEQSVRNVPPEVCHPESRRPPGTHRRGQDVEVASRGQGCGEHGPKLRGRGRPLGMLKLM